MGNSQSNKSSTSSKVRDMCFIALFCAIICVLSQVSIPMPMGVPMTLQTLIIPVAALILGTKRGTLATVLYVLIGMVGLPVFAGFKGGIGAILSLTGGFIVSFPIMAFLAGFFDTIGYNMSGKRRGVKYILMLLLGMTLGSVINYLVGTIWFAVVSGNTFGYAFAACVVPFIPTSIIKIAIATVLAPLLKSALVRAGVPGFSS